MHVKTLMGYIVYAFTIGLVLVFYWYNKYQLNSDPEFNTALLKRSMPLVAALGVLNFARYTIFSGSMGSFLGGVWEKGNKLYDYNMGLVHLSFCVVAVTSYLNDWSVETERAILLLYLLLLSSNMLTHFYAIVLEPTRILWRLVGLILFLGLIIPLYQIVYYSSQKQKPRFLENFL